METLYQRIGNCGPFQVYHSALTQCTRFAAAWSFNIMMFGIYDPGWRCAEDKVLVNASGISSPLVDQDSITYYSGLNASFGGKSNQRRHGYVNQSSCDIIDSCDVIEFDASSKTIVSEFSLICDRSFIPSIIICLLMVGMLVGVFVSGQVGELFGRKVSLYGSTAVCSLATILAIASPSWQVYAVFQFFNGAGVGGIMSTCNLYSMEFLDSKWRARLVGIPTHNVSFALFTVAIFLLRDWVYIHIAASIVCALASLGFFWTPESLRWLLLHDKGNQAERVVEKILRINKSPINVKEAMIVLTSPNGGDDVINNRTSTNIKDVNKAIEEHSSANVNVVNEAIEKHSSADTKGANKAIDKHTSSYNISRDDATEKFISADADGSDQPIEKHNSADTMRVNSLNPVDTDNVNLLNSVNTNGVNSNELSSANTKAYGAMAKGMSGHSNCDNDALISENSSNDAIIDRNYTYLDLFRHRKMCLITIKASVLWFAILMTYFCLNFSVKSLTGDFYVNALISSISEIPALISIPPATNILGRRRAIALYMFIASLGCFTVVVVSYTASDDVSGTITTVSAFVAKASAIACYNAISVFTVELYPTAVRNVGVGFVNTIGRIGAILSPFLIPRDQGSLLFCYIVLGVASVVNLAIVMSLPETKDKSLQDELTDD